MTATQDIATEHGITETPAPLTDEAFFEMHGHTRLQEYVGRTLEAHAPPWTGAAIAFTIFGCIANFIVTAVLKTSYDVTASFFFLFPLLCILGWSYGLNNAPINRRHVLGALNKALPSEQEALLAATAEFPVRYRTWKAFYHKLTTVTLDATFREQRDALLKEAMRRSDEEYARLRAFSVMTPPESVRNAAPGGEGRSKNVPAQALDVCAA